MEARRRHRLTGLEPDNVLAFLALLGLLRALEAWDAERPSAERLRPRAAWDLLQAPVRPVLVLSQALAEREVAQAGAAGLERLAAEHDFGGRRDLDYSPAQCRELLREAVAGAGVDGRARSDLLAALMTDAAVREAKNPADAPVEPTPFCLVFGQGHQHFLDRLAQVPRTSTPSTAPARKGPDASDPAGPLAEALFAPWRRRDATFSFRWDPEEGVRYALMAGDPTDPAYKTGTQHGANRLAAVGLAALTLAPVRRAGRVRVQVLGGRFDREGFAFAWPVWREPTSLATIRALLGHPGLWRADGLRHLGVEYVYMARRITIERYMNFARARVLADESASRA
jgi:hypothetical protein